WLAGCTPAARVGSGEAGSPLQVKVLGNPIEGNTADVEIRGVPGQPVQLNVVDLQGKPVHTQRIDQAGALERVSLPLGASTGILLLQISTPTQYQQVKLLTF
ncbi:T9SS type A sorting domain-containing protein, partial [Spirosoma agri]